MGAKITIDSATLFNKGLKAIGLIICSTSLWKIDVIVHPQSIIHSMVIIDTAIAQMGDADMRAPIQYALLIRTHERSGRN